MKATELYSVGYAAYNGNDDARKTYFMALAPIAKRFGKVYGVLPSLILASSSSYNLFNIFILQYC